MKSTRSLVAVSLAVVMAVGVTPLLASCANPIQAAIEQGAQKAVKDVTGGNVDLNVNGNGASMPSDWPSDVPVISGTIESSVRLGSGDTQTWSVTITIDDETSAWTKIKSDFEGAGFTTDFESVSSDGSMGSFSNGSHSAIVSTTKDSSGKSSVTYVVSKVSSSQ